MRVLKYKRCYDSNERSHFVNIDGEATVSEIKSIISKLIGVKTWYLDISQRWNIKNNDNTVNLDTTVEIIVHPEEREVPAHVMTTDPDCLTGDTDEPRVKLSCGHAITADNLYSSCLSQVNDRKTTLNCPDCRHELVFTEVTEKACLSDDEKSFFERRINFNVAEKGKTCPTCLLFCERINDSDQRVRCIYCSKNQKAVSDFCWDCEQPWIGNHICKKAKEELQNALQNCERITMEYNKMENVPKVRACPNCKNLIEHDGGCKTMTCKFCNQIFCFCCLRLAEKGNLPCGNHMVVCTVAPIQQV